MPQCGHLSTELLHPQHMLQLVAEAGERPGLLLQVVAGARPWQGGTVAISNFGFGGSNVHCLVSGRARAPPAPPALPAAPSPVPASESAPAVDPTVRCHYGWQLVHVHSSVQV